MDSRDLLSDDLLERGVYRAPCLGPHGETILYAVDHLHQHLPQESGGVRYLRPDDNPFTVRDDLWAVLNQIDPVPPAQEYSRAG